MAADAFLRRLRRDRRGGTASSASRSRRTWRTTRPAPSAEALRLFQRVGRPNVMIKIPGTPQGLPAIEECLYQGINVNVTLLFAVATYEAVAWAYLRALEQPRRGRQADRPDRLGGELLREPDRHARRRRTRGQGPGQRRFCRLRRLERLRGEAAIANAKRAYGRFRRIFADPRFARARGARAPGCNGRSGRARARRIPAIATCSTSRA